MSFPGGSDGKESACNAGDTGSIPGLGSMHETGCSGLVHWDDPEGWDGEGGGRGVSGWGDTCTPMGASCQCMAKTITIL